MSNEPQEKGATNTSTYDEQGGKNTNVDALKTTSNPSTSGGWGGGGGGGASAGQVLKNLPALTSTNADTLQLGWDKANDAYDIADDMNIKLRTQGMFQAMQGAADRFGQLLKEQNVVDYLKDAAGNLLNTSGIYDFMDNIARVNDLNDVSVLDTLRENMNNVLNNYYEQLAANFNNRNELAVDTFKGLRELATDHFAQVNNLDPSKAAKMVKDGRVNFTGDLAFAGDVYENSRAKNGSNTGSSSQKSSSSGKTNFYDANKITASMFTPKSTELFRPSNTVQFENLQKGLADKGDYNTSSANNKTYAERVWAGYQRR